jgi:hypothetical protein
MVYFAFCILGLWLRPEPSQSQLSLAALAWPRDSASQSRPKPGQSRGFQAKLGRNITRDAVPHPDITCIPSTCREVVLVDHLSGLAALAPLRSFSLLVYSVMDESVPYGPRPDPGGRYDSIQGHQLCKKILAKYLTYNPHDYILDSICPVIDGFNLRATTPMGSGKTGFFTLLNNACCLRNCSGQDTGTWE